jgi:acetolactate synthase-1/2/3 large subunit
MTVADYVTDYLIRCGVTDAFGVPGGVVLKLVYAMENRKLEMTPHLNYHEQMAGFSACGYAQAKRGLGVAYATRGPGIANMITCMIEAYQESIPVLFITAHSNRAEKTMRCEYDQEIDMVENVKKFTKYAVSIDSVNDVQKHVKIACHEAMDKRKGPVFLDFSTRLFGENIDIDTSDIYDIQGNDSIEIGDISDAIECIKDNLSKYKRPVILLGDGIRQADCIEITRKWLSSLNVPVISSRAAQDIVCNMDMYYGYIGSHGNRYTNFILSKADLIITIGNRLSFPINSESFKRVIDKAKILRFDIDRMEFQREFPQSVNFCIDIKVFIEAMMSRGCRFDDVNGWIAVCNKIKSSLNHYDLQDPVTKIAEYLSQNSKEATYICDVGNNEFWFSRAFEYIRPAGQVLYSKTFGTLGSALGRAIGAYYATRYNIVCVVGDQGFQYNIQELQYIAYWNLPITIILLNNMCSAMIRDHEKKIFSKYLHVTTETGYSVPNFRKIVEGYGIKFINASDVMDSELIDSINCDYPFVYEITFSEDIQLEPNLPKGNPCQRMVPLIDEDLYEYLDKL